MVSKRAQLQFTPLIGVLVLFSCTSAEDRIAANSLSRETHHYFSNSQSKDYFVLNFSCAYCEPDQGEYTNFDILSGSLMLSIYSNDHKKLFNHQWSVSNCFSMADNHYMSEDQKVKKFLYVVNHFFDSSRFSRADELKITGILKSADSLLLSSIEADTNSVGFSFIQEDFCVMYARDLNQAVLLRALRKDLLQKYDLF